MFCLFLFLNNKLAFLLTLFTCCFSRVCKYTFLETTYVISISPSARRWLRPLLLTQCVEDLTDHQFYEHRPEFSISMVDDDSTFKYLNKINYIKNKFSIYSSRNSTHHLMKLLEGSSKWKVTSFNQTNGN